MSTAREPAVDAARVDHNDYGRAASPTERARRAARIATASARPLPSLLVIGGIRCGSTSVHDLVAQAGYAPASGGGDAKRELHYFDEHHARGERWYRSWFPAGRGRSFESTPSYLCTPGVAPRARALVPEAKLVAVLRHPAVRATSHFAWRRSRDVEDAPDLPTALDEEPARLAEGRLLGCYGLHSRYEVGLRAWLDAYPAEQICILVAERLFAGDEEERARIAAFLDLDHRPAVPRSNVGPPRDQVLPAVAARLAPTIDAVEEIIGRPTGWSRQVEA